MKVIMIERDETTNVVWLSFKEGKAVVQSSLAINIAATVGNCVRPVLRPT